MQAVTHHHPIKNGCNGGDLCSPACHYRKAAARFKADPGLARRLAAEAAQGARQIIENKPLPPTRCLYLGEATGETVKCLPCGGNVLVKLQTCKIHGQCSTVKPLPGVACCVGCKDFVDRRITISNSAGGIGDGLLGACAIKGYAKLHANREIVYRPGPLAQGFVELLDLGENVLVRTYGDDKPSDLQMNQGYGEEFATKGTYSRIQRYCRNLGGVIPERPKIRFHGILKAHGNDYAGAIVLSPFTSEKSRQYPVFSWLTAERLLKDAGYRVVVLDAPNGNFPDRHKIMQSEVVLNAPPQRVASIVLAAACVVGNDSGLAHLGAILGVPTVVLTGQITGPSVYGFYGPHVEYLDGHLDCKGCWYQAPCNASCEPTCPDLASITPEEIVQTVKRIAR